MQPDKRSFVPGVGTTLPIVRGSAPFAGDGEERVPEPRRNGAGIVVAPALEQVLPAAAAAQDPLGIVDEPAPLRLGEPGQVDAGHFVVADRPVYENSIPDPLTDLLQTTMRRARRDVRRFGNALGQRVVGCG